MKRKKLSFLQEQDIDWSNNLDDDLFAQEKDLLKIDKNRSNTERFIQLYLRNNGVSSRMSSQLSDIILNFLDIIILEDGFTKSGDIALLRKVLKKYLDVKGIKSDFDDEYEVF